MLLFGTVMTDLLKADALEIAHTFGCEVVVDNKGNYVAMGANREDVELVEWEVQNFFKRGQGHEVR